MIWEPPRGRKMSSEGASTQHVTAMHQHIYCKNFLSCSVCSAASCPAARRPSVWNALCLPHPLRGFSLQAFAPEKLLQECHRASRQGQGKESQSGAGKDEAVGAGGVQHLPPPPRWAPPSGPSSGGMDTELHLLPEFTVFQAQLQW